MKCCAIALALICLTVVSYAQPRVAVLPFDPVMDSLYAFQGKESILDYRKALQEMIATDLSKGTDIRVIELSDINNLVKREHLIPELWNDVHVASQIASALGADYAVVGTYGEYSRQIRVDTRIVIPASSEVPPGYSATGVAKAWEDLPTAASQVGEQIRAILVANASVRPVSQAILYPEGDLAAFGLTGDTYAGKSRLVVWVNAPAADVEAAGVTFQRCDRIDLVEPPEHYRDGACKLAMLSAGQVTVKVNHRGFLPCEESLTLARGKAYRLEVRLQPIELPIGR